MASRHRHRKALRPGHRPGRLSRAERAVEHRRVRHATRQALHAAVYEDPEAVGPLPQPVNTVREAEPEPIDEMPRGRGGFKVWKTKMWKRRDSWRLRQANLASAYWSGQIGVDDPEDGD